tara:strand:- start:1650 stop:1808 length:159 start_codon:yes stop_codon:yes gene_type:complete
MNAETQTPGGLPPPLSKCHMSIKNLTPSRNTVLITSITTAVGCAIYYYYNRD